MKLLCPRCNNDCITVLSESDPIGLWTIHRCEECFFAWRKSEPEYITNPDKYDEHFKLTSEDIYHSLIVPEIPEKIK